MRVMDSFFAGVEKSRENSAGNVWLQEVYSHIERIRQIVWMKLYEEAVLSGDEQALEKIPSGAKAEYGDGVLKVVVNDYLPHRKAFRKVAESKLMKYFWINCVQGSIERLRKSGVEIPVFSPALVQIVAYLPLCVEWDVDNTAYRFIVNALRYAKVINSDKWDDMALMVIGRVDKKNPRTEIYVCTPNQDITELVTQVRAHIL